jgi:hypothetical protein
VLPITHFPVICISDALQQFPVDCTSFHPFATFCYFIAFCGHTAAEQGLLSSAGKIFVLCLVMSSTNSETKN